MSPNSDGDDGFEWQYICRGCQTRENPATGETEDVDKVRDGLNSKGTAETLADIHRVLTGHRPEVMPKGVKDE